jgi:hypothetical protein
MLSLRQLFDFISSNTFSLATAATVASTMIAVLTQLIEYRRLARRASKREPIEMQLTETLELLQKNSEQAAMLVSEFRAEAAGRMKAIENVTSVRLKVEQNQLVAGIA